MEIYVAISDFKPPIVDGSQNILEFNKGDTFEIFDCHKTGADWWGARALKSNSIGYVPSRYMQYEERRIGKLLPTDYQDQKETSLKRLSDMQAEPDHRAPDEVVPQTPVPDYGDAATPQNESVFKFAEKFKTVLTSIQTIEKMYDQQEEPEPDYNDDIESDQLPVHLGPARTDRSGSEASDDGLQIQPKKLTNPCLESNTRQALHKELLLNYKRGVNVLEKPELNKVLSQRRDTQKRKEMQEQMANNRTSLEMKLELRAKKTDDDMKTISEKDEANKPELQKAFAKFAQKSNGHMK